jgi:hypothetical protein
MIGWMWAAWAGDMENWQQLHRIQLAESADGDLPGAIAAYEQLTHQLDDQDPLLAETLYWLGKARFAAKDSKGASDALTACARRVSAWRQRCLDLLGEVALERSSIKEVPTRWDFSGDHGVLHPSQYEDKERSLRIENVANNARLAWTTSVDPRRDDLVIVGFARPTPTPKGFRVTLRSGLFDALIRLIVYDAFGRRYQIGQISVPAQRDVPVDIRFAGVQAEGPSEPPLDPAAIDRLIIQDVTAYYSTARGANTLYLDDLEVY